MEAGDGSAGSKPCPIRITSAAHGEVTVQGGQFKTYDTIKAIYCVCISSCQGCPLFPQLAVGSRTQAWWQLYSRNAGGDLG